MRDFLNEPDNLHEYFITVYIVSCNFSAHNTTVYCVILCCAILHHIVPYHVLGRNKRDFLNGLDNLHEYVIVVYTVSCIVSVHNTTIYGILCYAKLYHIAQY